MRDGDFGNVNKENTPVVDNHNSDTGHTGPALELASATTEHRRRLKSMSRRSGQAGTIVKQAGWYRVRFRLDVQGQYARTLKNVKICPVCGPGLLTKPERERRKVEIVNSYGANSLERFSKVVVGTTERTFKEQAKWWLSHIQTRTFPKPVKPATARGWQSYLVKW